MKLSLRALVVAALALGNRDSILRLRQNQRNCETREHINSHLTPTPIRVEKRREEESLRYVRRDEGEEKP